MEDTAVDNSVNTSKMDDQFINPKDPFETGFIVPLPYDVKIERMQQIHEVKAFWRQGLRKIEEMFQDHIAQMNDMFEDKTMEMDNVRGQIVANHDFLK